MESPTLIPDPLVHPEAGDLGRQTGLYFCFELAQGSAYHQRLLRGQRLLRLLRFTCRRWNRLTHCVLHRAGQQSSPAPPPALVSQEVLPSWFYLITPHRLGSPPRVQPLLLSACGQASFALQPRWLTAAWLPRTAQLPCCLFPRPVPAWPCGCFPPWPWTEMGCVVFEGGMAGEMLEADFPHPLPPTQNLWTPIGRK